MQRELRSCGFRGQLVPECPLAPLVTWRIGGPAELVASPADEQDLVLLVSWAVEHGVAWRVLGNGSNLLVHDRGVRGLVIRLRRILDAVQISGTTLSAGAGAMFPLVANQAASAGLAGIEFGAGIPGTIGGAIRMNAGWHEHEIGAFVTRVAVLDEAGARRELDRGACAFRYRGSRFRDERRSIVLEAVLELAREDSRTVRERMNGFTDSRKRNQPTELPSCGSVFLKPAGDFAGRLIEEAGLKGLRVGRMEVSRKHANFFVNLGGATSADALELVARVEAEVERRSGVRLVREFELWE
jgi:UDP-N-acetylmuramate dehydrogenase